jgi:hypothetical protein
LSGHVRFVQFCPVESLKAFHREPANAPIKIKPMKSLRAIGSPSGGREEVARITRITPEWPSRLVGL